MSSNSEHVLRHRRRKKLILIEYKGGKCEECGYDKMCPPAFDFHHKNPKTKEFQIGSSLQLSLDKLKKEVDKCQLLCNRCHAELHFNLRKLNNDDIALRQQPAESLIIKCRLCQIEFETKKRNSKYCSQQCHNVARRKCDRPTHDELLCLLQSESMVSVGKRFGVSDNTIRKWLNQTKRENNGRPSSYTTE